MGLLALGRYRAASGPVAAALVCAAAIACSDRPAERAKAPEPASPLVVYSGRNEALVGPLLARFEEQRGVALEVRYGDTAELAATLLEEGAATPADLFLSQDAGALGALSREGRFRPLPQELLERVPSRFRSPAGDWVGLSGRVRTVVYDTAQLAPGELPQSLEEVADPRYRGRFGIAPTNASFQAHLAVYRAVRGRAALDRLLAGMVANEPQSYPNNSAIVQAVAAGEIEWGLVNHYYLWRALEENPEGQAANFVMPEGEASSFVNLAGAGLLSDDAAARELLDFLLSAEAQEYFARQTYEYPLVPAVSPAAGLPPLAELRTPDVDFGEVAAVLEETLAAIRDSGLLESGGG